MTSPGEPDAPQPKLSQREQLVVYFGFADERHRAAPRTDDDREEIRSRRIAGILAVGLLIGLLWAAAGAVPALVVAVLGAIWFGSALRKYGGT